MTHPDGRSYTPEERREIVDAARATARQLLFKIETLAKIEEELMLIAREDESDAGS